MIQKVVGSGFSYDNLGVWNPHVLSLDSKQNYAYIDLYDLFKHI